METPVIGVIGAGQLARMMQQAAIGLGVPLRLLADSPEQSAALVVADTEIGDFTDLDALRTWAKGCDVVTFDHEHVPVGHVEALVADGVVCRPGPGALLYAQDKGAMRRRLAALGVPCPRHAVVSHPADVTRFAGRLGGYPVVLKVSRGGYDGKGVWVVDDEAAAAAVFAAVPDGLEVLAEERVDFVRELSAVAVRAPNGQSAAYPIVESVQREGICVEVIAPAPGLDPVLAVAAQQTAMEVAAALDVTGVLAVELFHTRDGRILVNELAMRPHNTGHWSIDGAVTSQFENHLRAILDLPLGSPKARAPWTVTVNILGGTASTLFDGYPHVQARDPMLRVHLYGKLVRPGRKVGHVTAYGDSLEETRARARHAADWFAGTTSDQEGDR